MSITCWLFPKAHVRMSAMRIESSQKCARHVVCIFARASGSHAVVVKGCNDLEQVWNHVNTRKSVFGKIRCLLYRHRLYPLLQNCVVYLYRIVLYINNYGITALARYYDAVKHAAVGAYEASVCCRCNEA